MRRYSKAFVVSVLLALVSLASFAAVRSNRTDGPWAHVPRPAPHTDHSTFFKGPFTDGPSVTKACLECHEDAARQVMHTAHWNLEGDEVLVPGHEQPMRIGKRNLINNFCIGISSNWPGCTQCHIGYGWEDEHFDLTNETLVDCLVCHDNSGAYKKQVGGAGRPDPKVDLLQSAKSVGLPTRTNCGGCHFQGGGGNAVKHGDLDDTLLFPSERIDVHMGRFDFQCIDCHQAQEHLLPGRIMTVSVDRKNRLRCTACHEEKPHADVRLNAHTARVACQTCHIPFMAVDEGTKLTWDWSEAGQDLGITDHHLYLKIKGRFAWAKGVPPDYAWYNETSTRYILGDKMDPAKPTPIAAPLGSRDDPESRIYPFKVHRGKQIYDVQHRYFLLPHVHGDQGFWTQFNWQVAARIGAQFTGLEYSGEYDFAPTEMYVPQNHMVTPAEKALQCQDCHGPDGRLDWQKLGYEHDPLGRPVLEHPEFPLVDVDYEAVQETGKPLSTTATCSQCHEVDDEGFKATHNYHSSLDREALPAERALLLQQGPVTPQAEGEEMNCFLCHMAEPNHEERQRALQSGKAEWSISATLIGTGLLTRTDDGYVWNQEAFSEEMVEPGTSYVSERSCGACHGLVHSGKKPLFVDIGSGTDWTTEKTGQVFSSQRIRLSGMNLQGKDGLARSWDVHAERLVQCGDCHYSRGRPERLAGEVKPTATASLGEQRRRCESCHSLDGTHGWLPELQRHFAAVSCESCHVPRLHMAAQEQIDATVARLDRQPQRSYRGIEGGRIDDPVTSYIEGYRPLLLLGTTADGSDRVIPYNLVTEWVWQDSASGGTVPNDTVRAAWIEGDAYRPGVLAAFDRNGDGRLDDGELRLDDSVKIALIRANLLELGVQQPEIVGRVRSYHIHHSVTHGDQVGRDCSGCHEPDKSKAVQTAEPEFELAPYVPGGVVPSQLAGEGVRLEGEWQVTADGRLVFKRARSLATSYQRLKQEGQRP